MSAAGRALASLTAVHVATSREDEGRTARAIAGAALLALAAAGALTLARARGRLVA